MQVKDVLDSEGELIGRTNLNDMYNIIYLHTYLDG